MDSTRAGVSARNSANGWIGGTEGVAREDIPIYRYAEVRKAIANNELIFIVRVRPVQIFSGS
jgi:hypothetical protein